MEDLDSWRLCDDLSIKQAALLIVDQSPTLIQDTVEALDPDKRPPGYDATKTALSNAIQSRILPARVAERILYFEAYDEYENEVGGELNTFEPDIDKTKIRVIEIKKWLEQRNSRPDFFFPDKVDNLDYLDSSNSRYSPKLAAAIDAWIGIANNPSVGNETRVKKALEEWLHENANRYGLIKLDGKPNILAIGEISKVANWDPKGGAPKTPSGKTSANVDDESPI